MFKRLFVAAALTLCAGCDLPLGSDDDDHVSVRMEGGELVVRNDGRTPIYTYVEVYSNAVVDWAPCADPDVCDAIPPGYAGHTPVAHLPNYENRTADSAAVFTWRLRRTFRGEHQVVDLTPHRVGF